MLTYAERAKSCSNALSQRLFSLMEKKETNLGAAVDVRTKKELLHIADLLGPDICILKTHIDIIDDFDQDLVVQLQELAHRHDFLIFEDRKFADIGNTVKMQYEGGVYHIASWAHITNAHPLPGPGIVEALRESGLPLGRGLLLLAQMSAGDNLFTEEYTAAAVRMAQQYPDFVMGFIAMRALLTDSPFVHMTPGVQLQAGGDSLRQTFRTPQEVIGKCGSDIILVGRGIYHAADPRKEAAKYRDAGWKAYLGRLQ